MSEKASTNKGNEEEVKRLDEDTERATKKSEYLKKKKRASAPMKFFLYLRYHFVSLILMNLIFITVVGFVGGSIARLIWEIWVMIFSVNL